MIPSAHVELTTNVCPATKSAAGRSVSNGAGSSGTRGCSRSALRYLRDVDRGVSCGGEIGEEERERRDVQVVTQYPGAENAHGEEIAAQAGVAAENAGDGLVAIFFVHESVGRSVLGRHDWLTIPSDDVPCGRIECYGC